MTYQSFEKTWNLKITVSHVSAEKYEHLKQSLLKIPGFVFNIEKIDSEFDVIDT